MEEDIDILKQHALIAANEIREKEKEDNKKTQAAYEMVKKLKSEVCPKCWVDGSGVKSEFEVFAHTRHENIHKCMVCGFEVFLPKPNT